MEASSSTTKIMNVPINPNIDKKRKSNVTSIYSKTLITRKIPVNIKYVGSNIKQTLENIISSEIEGNVLLKGLLNH